MQSKVRRFRAYVAVSVALLWLEPGWAGLAGESGASAQVVHPPESPTRVVLITVDTLRADHLGSYGGPVATPHMDRLAREGVLLEQACSPMASTGPAHASLLTGLHPWRHGTLDNAVPMDPRIPTLADRLRERGVETAAFVSSYILQRRFGFHQGFDTYGFEPDREFTFRGQHKQDFWARGERTAKSAMGWLTTHDAGSFFLWVHFFDPHTPYAPPVGYAVSPQDPVDLAGKSVPLQLADMAHLERSIRAYRGEVRYADAQVGKIVERLALLGLLDETVIVLTSDHGEGLGDHGWLEHGASVYEELIRVPLIVRGPGFTAGRRLAGNAQLEDLTPTILGLFDVSKPADLDGVDLLDWLQGRAEVSPRRAVLGRRKASKGSPDIFFQRSWPSKWIGRIERPGYAFDLIENPREEMNVRGTGVPEELSRSLEKPVSSTPRGVDPSPEVRRALEELGYVQ